MLRRPLRTTRVALAMTGLIAATVVALTSATPASAEDCDDGGYVGGGVTCTIPGNPGNPGNPGGNGGVVAPTCPLAQYDESLYSDKNRTSNFCEKDRVCFTTDLVPPIAPPDGPPPNEDSVMRTTYCYNGIGSGATVVRAFWSDDEEPPSPLEMAQTAIGLLDFTTPAVNVSPATRTLVNLPTWFWLTGSQQRVTASAFTLTVTATFRSMSVEPGDGSGSFRCDEWVTSAAQAEQSCNYPYRKASVRGSESVDGRPAYRASVTTLYDLTFTLNGNPTTIPGAPTTIDGPAASAPVRVDEVQSVVRDNR